MVEKQISDYVTVIIDEDEDVRIIDKFMGITESILPKDEALGVAEFIVEYFENPEKFSHDEKNENTKDDSVSDDTEE